MESLVGLIGLICNFKAGRDAKSQDEFNEFLEWLTLHNHHKVMEEFEANAKLSLSIKSLLLKNNEELEHNLDSINESLVEICNQINGFKEVSLSLPRQNTPDQCKSIMLQLVSSGGSSFLEQIHLGGTNYPITDTGLEIKPTEQKFMKEDLDKLVSLGLLRIQYIGNDSRLFHLTRDGQEWVDNGL